MDEVATELIGKDGQIDVGRYLRVLRAEPPKILYHFTSTEGLVGIVRDRKLRLTRAVCSNDASEVRHVLDFARAAVDAITEIDQASQGLSGAARAALEKLQQRLRDDNAGWHGEMNLRHTLVFDAGLPDPYLACFCADAEPGLLHWGHYGRAGEGFAIEVDSSRLADEWKQRFVKVSYDGTQRALDIVKLLESFLLAEKGEAKPKPDDVLGRERATIVADRTEAILRAVSVGMKNSEFQGEKRMARDLASGGRRRIATSHSKCWCGSDFVRRNAAPDRGDPQDRGRHQAGCTANGRFACRLSTWPGRLSCRT